MMTFTKFLETYNTNILRILITIAILTLLVYIVVLLRNLRLISKINKTKNDEPKKIIVPKLELTNPRLNFKEIDEVINGIASDIINGKYFLKYRMSDKITIPDFEEETKKIAEEIINSLGEELARDMKYFYSEEYICATVTRRVQFFLVEYLDKYKPKVH